jgi:hypothetical protein
MACAKEDFPSRCFEWTEERSIALPKFRGVNHQEDTYRLTALCESVAFVVLK